MRFWTWPILIILISLITHLAFFDRPQSVVFDEIYQGSFLGYYATGEYYFDVHPPLGRLLLKAVGDVFGVDYGAMNFGAIGNSVNSDIFFLRLLPLLAGILFPLIVFYICRRLKMSDMNSFFVGIFIVFENSLIVQSKFILTDSLLLLFGFCSILFYLNYKANESIKVPLIISALFAGACFSVKWTGLSFPLLIIIFDFIKETEFKKVDLRKYLRLVLVYAVIGFFVYLASFYIHLSILKNPGPGDAFMSKTFQYDSFPSKFIELNLAMYNANVTMTATHPYSSQLFSWPTMKRPIFYWQNLEEGKYIYFLGNPFLYYISFISILYCILISLVSYINKTKIPQTMLFVIIGYLVNFIPFMFIGRVMFLYHYSAALVFGLISIGVIFDSISTYKYKNIVIWATVFLSICAFIFFSPLTYGLHLDFEQLNNRMWFSSWR